MVLLFVVCHDEQEKMKIWELSPEKIVHSWSCGGVRCILEGLWLLDKKRREPETVIQNTTLLQQPAY
jgi:hypothetical protein